MTQLCLTIYHFPSFTHKGDDTLPRHFLDFQDEMVFGDELKGNKRKWP